MLFHKINSKKESNETKKNTQQNNSNQSVALKSIANGKFVTVKSTTSLLIASKDKISDSTKFQVVEDPKKNGWYKLISFKTKNSVHVLLDKSLCAKEISHDNGYIFFIEYLKDGCIFCGTCIRGIYGPKFITVNDDNYLSAEADSIQQNEVIEIVKIDDII